MSDWAALVGIVPDLLTLGMRIAEQHAAARAQRPVAELTRDDLRAAAADLVARSVPVDAILERASGGVWHQLTGPGASSLPLGGGEDYTSPRPVADEAVAWDSARFASPQLQVVMSTDVAGIVADPEDKRAVRGGEWTHDPSAEVTRTVGWHHPAEPVEDDCA